MLRSVRVAMAVAALAAVAAACTPQPAAAPPPPAPPAPHGATGQGPVISPFTCPVAGSTYTDDFGRRGTGWHYGIDMMVASGTNVFAVKAGTVRYVANEGAGGHVVYLTGNDGNVYFYAHLLDFVGTDRTVTAGELIAHSGQTGNAGAPHLHFEIRQGGVNGTRVDAYNSLRANSC